MYIRRTHTSNSATGERYATHRLVQSERVGGRVRQVTLLNLGRHFALPQEEWPALCARVEELHRGQGTLLGSAGGALEREAQRLAARLLAREGKDAPTASRPAGGEVPGGRRRLAGAEPPTQRRRGVGGAVGHGRGELCRVAPGPGTERPATRADRRCHHWAPGRPGLGTGDPPLAGRTQWAGGIARCRLRGDPSGAVLSRGGPVDASPGAIVASIYLCLMP